MNEKPAPPARARKKAFAAPIPPELETIFSNVFELYGVLTNEGKIVDLKGEVFRETNVDPDLLIGQSFSECVFWQSSANTPRLLDTAMKNAARGIVSKTVLDFRVSAAKKIAVELCLQPAAAADDGPQIFFSGRQITRPAESGNDHQKESEALLFAAENAEIGLWFWDLVNDKIYSTPICNELFEVPPYEKLTYDRFMNAVHPDDRERVAESLVKAHTSGTRYAEEYRVVYSDETIDWISAEGRSFLDANGQPSKMTSVVRKITEEKLAAEELSLVYDREMRAREEAVEANRSKDLFLAFVSHELRSPLNAILGWSKILLTKSVDEETRQNALETIERSARIQTNLINDLVDSARVTSGKIKLEFRPINLHDVVKLAYHSQKPTADGRNIKFEFGAADEDLRVFGDAARLQQVFSNLISNALKFTPEGGKIAISLTRVGDSAEVVVKDTGRGISAEALPHIFRQFSQGDLGREKSKIGLGLGLSIVKTLVNKHGGQVTGESGGADQGSTFTVTLPLMKDASNEAVTEGSANEKPLAGLRILLVEDDADSREVLQLFLEQSGALVLSCESADEAFRRLRASSGSPPDLILSDIAMPGEDGYSMMKRIRELPPAEGGSVPALALSAFATRDNKQQALESGFQRYEAKPFEPDLLIHDILELARERNVRI